MDLHEAELDDNLSRLKANIEKLSTVEEFERRLEVSEIIYAYVVKRFAAKFPEAAARWVESGE